MVGVDRGRKQGEKRFCFFSIAMLHFLRTHLKLSILLINILNISSKTLNTLCSSYRISSIITKLRIKRGKQLRFKEVKKTVKIQLYHICQVRFSQKRIISSKPECIFVITLKWTEVLEHGCKLNPSFCSFFGSFTCPAVHIKNNWNVVNVLKLWHRF